MTNGHLPVELGDYTTYQLLLNPFSDQTPTPTKFLKNCEEMGLFQELSKNPFEDSFKKAMDDPLDHNDDPTVSVIESFIIRLKFTSLQYKDFEYLYSSPI